MKKLFSLVLALVMALSLTTMAWGADPVAKIGNVEYDTLAAAVAAVADGETIELLDDVTEDGIVLTEVGVTIEGNGHTFTATNVGDKTADDTTAAITSTDGVTVHNLKIVGGARGIYVTGPATQSFEFYNVEIVDSCRAFNVSGTAAANVSLTVSDSILAGKVSFTETLDFVDFVNCKFITNGGAKGDVVEPWGNAYFTNCSFADGYAVNLDDVIATTPDATILMFDCVYGGKPLADKNVDDLLTVSSGSIPDDIVIAFHEAVGATNTYTGLYAKTTDQYGELIAIDSLNYNKAVDNKVDKNGNYEDDGNVAYYTISVAGDMTFYWSFYAKVNTLAQADVVVYTDAAAKNVYMYLEEVDPFYVGDGVVTKNFGTKCGQYSNDEDDGFDDEATYYELFGYLFVGVEEGDPYDGMIMVNGKLVAVNVVDIPVNEHKSVITTDKNGNIESIKCAVCGMAAVKAGNYASIPEAVIKADLIVTGPDAAGAYWYFPVAAASSPSTDKTVTSADTFDAGIAMYVGMSVMAAAGSAVVIGKKKEF